MESILILIHWVHGSPVCFQNGMVPPKDLSQTLSLLSLPSNHYPPWCCHHLKTLYLHSAPRPPPSTEACIVEDLDRHDASLDQTIICSLLDQLLQWC